MAWREAIDGAYPPGFWDAYARLRDRDPAGLETAIAFLEADPWLFRSGCVKAALIRYINRLELLPGQRARLRAVVPAAVDHRDRREFRAYCRLARRLDAAEFRRALEGRAKDVEPRVRQRARWVLVALDQ